MRPAEGPFMDAEIVLSPSQGAQGRQPCHCSLPTTEMQAPLSTRDPGSLGAPPRTGYSFAQTWPPEPAVRVLASAGMWISTFLLA